MKIPDSALTVQEFFKFRQPKEFLLGDVVALTPKAFRAFLTIHPHLTSGERLTVGSRERRAEGLVYYCMGDQCVVLAYADSLVIVDPVGYSHYLKTRILPARERGPHAAA